jgi:LysM repeat protein
MIRRFLRQLLILVVVIAIFAAVSYYIYVENVARERERYYVRVTDAVSTAVARALFDATRTAEAPLPQHRLIVLGENDTLSDIAARYNTTVEVLRMANGLAQDVVSGAGTELIVPEGVQTLTPARRLRQYEAIAGDTLSSIAEQNDVLLEYLALDNPVLAQRGLNPGDIVFIPTLL